MHLSEGEVVETHARQITISDGIGSELVLEGRDVSVIDSDTGQLQGLRYVGTYTCSNEVKGACDIAALWIRQSRPCPSASSAAASGGTLYASRVGGVAFKDGEA